MSMPCSCLGWSTGRLFDVECGAARGRSVIFWIEPLQKKMFAKRNNWALVTKEILTYPLWKVEHKPAGRSKRRSLCCHARLCCQVPAGVLEVLQWPYLLHPRRCEPQRLELGNKRVEQPVLLPLVVLWLWGMEFPHLSWGAWTCPCPVAPWTNGRLTTSLSLWELFVSGPVVLQMTLGMLLRLYETGFIQLTGDHPWNNSKQFEILGINMY